MKNLNQSPPKIRTVAIIVGLICGSMFLSSGCEKDIIDPDQNTENTFKDPNENMPSCWTALDNMKKKRNAHMIATLEKKIYVAGGVSEKSGNTFELYDPESDTWTTRSAPAYSGMIPRWGFGTCVANRKVYVIGGVDCQEPPWSKDVNAMSTVEVYNPENNTWEEKTAMPIKKSI